MRVTALNLIVEKWRRNASNARPSYEEGIQNPRFPWANASSKAKGTYAEGVQRAIELDLYSKGVQAAGDDKWRTRSLTLGASRYTAGIAASQSAYEQGFAPYRQILEGLTLPAKYARGDERNIERVAVIARALHEKRMQLMGAA